MNDPTGAAAQIVEEGFAVVPDLLAAEDVDASRRALDAVFAAEEDIATERSWRTESYRVAYALPAKDALFADLCTSDPLVNLARSVLGPSAVVASCNGFEMLPGGSGQRLHTDQEESVPGRCLYLHVLCVLDEFTVENGATRVVPRSHLDHQRVDDHAGRDDGAIAVPAPAGSVIAYDGRLWHAGSANRTDRRRRALHVYFGRSWVRPDWDFSATMPASITAELSPAQRRLFGLGSGPRSFDVERREVTRR